MAFCASRRAGVWVAQRKIGGRRMTSRFIRDGELIEQETYVDCSIFASSGVATRASGGACRFSELIVNIGQGGGLAPLLLESEAKSLTA